MNKLTVLNNGVETGLDYNDGIIRLDFYYSPLSITDPILDYFNSKSLVNSRAMRYLRQNKEVIKLNTTDETLLENTDLSKAVAFNIENLNNFYILYDNKLYENINTHVFKESSFELLKRRVAFYRDLRFSIKDKLNISSIENSTSDIILFVDRVDNVVKVYLDKTVEILTLTECLWYGKISFSKLCECENVRLSISRRLFTKKVLIIFKIKLDNYHNDITNDDYEDKEITTDDENIFSVIKSMICIYKAEMQIQKNLTKLFNNKK